VQIRRASEAEGPEELEKGMGIRRRVFEEPEEG
jgi:hypothetical protein